MSFLLARVTDESDLPDDYYSFVQQFTYWQGSYASQLDTESLMILLWQMDKRIKKLEANQSNLQWKDLAPPNNAHVHLVIGLLPTPKTIKMSHLAYTRKFCPINQGKIKKSWWQTIATPSWKSTETYGRSWCTKVHLRSQTQVIRSWFVYHVSLSKAVVNCNNPEREDGPEHVLKLLINKTYHSAHDTTFTFCSIHY